MYGNLKLTPLQTPTPGTGGRSRIELGQQHLHVLAAYDGLLEALAAAEPPAGDDGAEPDAAGTTALAAWRERTALVQALRSEVEMEAMKIAIGWRDKTVKAG